MELFLVARDPAHQENYLPGNLNHNVAEQFICQKRRQDRSNVEELALKMHVVIGQYRE